MIETDFTFMVYTFPSYSNGEKGDIMIPTSHIFEGTADNYPFENALKLEDFQEVVMK
jgi:hypothetical protein